jgi:DNA-binding protein HU-beta
MTQGQFKTEWAQLVGNRIAGITKKDALALLEDLVGYIARTTKKGDKVTIPQLGTLVLAKRAARWGRNPQTGEKIKIKASKKISFRASKTFKEAAGIVKEK